MSASFHNKLMRPFKDTLTSLDIAISIVIGLIIGIIWSIGHGFYATEGLLSFSDPWLWIRGLFYGCAIFIVTFCMIPIWKTYCNLQEKTLRKSLKFSAWLLSLSSIQRISLFTSVILLLWVPAFLAFFPGNYSSDGPLQVTYLFNDGVLDLHWPPAHTLILAGLLALGNMIFGTYNAGLIIFCIVQAAFLAFALSYAANALLTWNVPLWVVAFTNGLIVCNPVTQSYAVTTAKDSMFAGFFVLVTVSLFEIIDNPSRICKTSFFCKFALFATCMCLLRKQGVYVLAFTLFVALFFMRSRKERFRTILALCMVFVISGIFSFCTNAIFTTRNDSARELLSVPSQQIVRTYMYDYDSLTNNQLREIGTYYDIDQLERGRTTDSPWESTPLGQFYDAKSGSGYLAPIADPSKAALKDQAFQNNPIGFISMYFSIMQGHETEYVRAFLWGEIGYTYPTDAAFNRWTGLSPWNEFNRTITSGGQSNQISDYHSSTLFPRYLQWLSHGTWDMFKGKLPLTIWVSPALPFLALLFSMVLLITRKGTKRQIISWLFPFLYWISLALAPVMCVRYVVPLFFCIPLIISLPFIRLGNRSTQKPISENFINPGVETKNSFPHT